jgi:hypothetical protein
MVTTAKELETRKHPCWITSFLEYTENLPSPERFRKWAAISAIAGALERRCWVKTGAGELYPNMFVLLVAPPGVGKDFAINPARDLWAATQKLNIAPAAMTHKGLVDHLADSHVQQQYIDDKGRFVNYHSILVSVPELGVLIPSHDLAFLSTLNDLYNCGKVFAERSRSKGDILKIENPHIHIIAGTQPKYLGSLFPEEAYGMGFTSRIVMIYWGTPTKRSLFGSNKFSPKLQKSLADDMLKITQLKGEFYLDQETIAALEQWHAIESDNDRPVHTKLIHYNARRIMHLIKLSMVYSISRSSDMIITIEDFNDAKETLLDAEQAMPEIFKEISSGGNASEIEEAFHFIVRLHNKTQKPIPEHKLIHYLATKVPANQISYLVETMVRSAIIKEAGEFAGLNLPGKEKYYVPQALNAVE